METPRVAGNGNLVSWIALLLRAGARSVSLLYFFWIHSNLPGSYVL